MTLALLPQNVSNSVFVYYKYTHVLHSSHLTNTNNLSYKLIKYLFFYFFQIIPDLNFYPADEGNYTSEEPNGSSSFARIFSNYDQNNSYPN
jgi:hypothetical protein